MPTYTLDHGVIARDGVPMLTMVRARWGDDAPPAAELDALSERILALLNAETVSNQSIPAAQEGRE